MPQHRAQDPRPDPKRDERPGSDGEGAPRRPRGAPRSAGVGRRPWRERDPDGRVRHRRPTAPRGLAHVDGPGAGSARGVRAFRLRAAHRYRTRGWQPGRMGRMTIQLQRPVEALLGRSNRLGADPRTTNYAGGNTSAKGTAIDPVTGTSAELLWVKGSGGDLGTLTEDGLSVLRLDRLRALVDVYA